MSKIERPLSPHIGIYKWQLHMFMSILHRATGVFLGIGIIGFAWWLLAIASGPDSYNEFSLYLSAPLGQIILLGFSFAFIYHSLNGIRHLFWDAGLGLSVDSVRQTGWVTMFLSFALTAGLWAVALKLI